jgi:hypothetical protein
MDHRQLNTLSTQTEVELGALNGSQVQECLMGGIPNRQDFVQGLLTKHLAMRRRFPQNFAADLGQNGAEGFTIGQVWRACG